MDEKEGPYKVVGLLARDPRVAQRFMIVIQEKNDRFERELIPDVGTGDTARLVCNLLNKEWRMRQAREEMEEVQSDAADRFAGEGIPDSDQ